MADESLIWGSLREYAGLVRGQAEWQDCESMSLN